MPTAHRNAILGCVFVGLALRLPGLFGDLWLDEVWSLELAATLANAGEVFTALHHSNNHHLNTLWMYAWGDAPHWAWYRVPALLTGLASIVLAACVARRRGLLDAVLAAWLTAVCFALVHFSSEARGSGPTVAFALAALLFLDRDHDAPRTANALGFGASVIAGFCFQLVFCFFWAGALVTGALRLWRRQPAALPLLGGLARLHALPLAALALLWWVDLRFLRVGGGEPLDLAWLTARTVGYGLGLPAFSSAAPVLAALALLVVGAGVWNLARRGDDWWLGLLIAIVVAPTLVITWFDPAVLAVRYFLIGIQLTLLLVAWLAADAMRSGGAPRVIAVAVLALTSAMHLVHVARFIEHGRGGYSAALARMASESDGPIVVGSDHDFRVGRVLAYHARTLEHPERLQYRSADDWPEGGPDWLVVHRQETPTRPHPWVDAGTTRFQLVATYEHAAISGYAWLLYRNAALDGAAPR